MEQWTNWIETITGFQGKTLEKIFTSLVVILFLWIVRTVVVRILWRRTENAQVRYRWHKSTMYTAVFIGMVLVSRIWFPAIQSLATLLGLVTAGVAIALQDLIKSMAGWGFILWRKPFAVGDRIEVGKHRGM